MEGWRHGPWKLSWTLSVPFSINNLTGRMFTMGDWCACCGRTGCRWYVMRLERSKDVSDQLLATSTSTKVRPDVPKTESLNTSSPWHRLFKHGQAYSITSQNTHMKVGIELRHIEPWQTHHFPANRSWVSMTPRVATSQEIYIFDTDI